MWRARHDAFVPVLIYDIGSAKSGNGPIDPRLQVRLRAAIWIIGPVGLVVGMAVTQVGWIAPYSPLHNTISDLGAVGCGIWPAGSTQYGPSTVPHYVCSLCHLLFGVSIIVFGRLVAGGAMLVRSGFPQGGPLVSASRWSP